jgi:hypothetical protein
LHEIFFDLEDSVQYIEPSAVVLADTTGHSSFLPVVDGFVFSSAEANGSNRFVTIQDSGNENIVEVPADKYFAHFSDWLVILVLLLCLVVIRCRSLYTKYFNQLIHAVCSRAASIKLYREKNVLFFNMSRWLMPASMAIISVFTVYVAARFLGEEWIAEHMLLSIFSVFLVLSLFYGYQFLIHGLVGVLFYVEPVSKEHLFNQRVLVMGLGVCLLPLTAMLPFVPEWMFQPLILGGGVIFGFFLMIWMVRTLQIIFDHRLSFFYLILYICSLEILPIAILIKTMQSVA